MNTYLCERHSTFAPTGGVLLFIATFIQGQVALLFLFLPPYSHMYSTHIRTSMWQRITTVLYFVLVIVCSGAGAEGHLRLGQL